MPTTLFEISVAWGVALFLFLSAAFHWLVAAPGASAATSPASRPATTTWWAEYSLSSSMMIVLIATLTGISDVAALIGLLRGERRDDLLRCRAGAEASGQGSLWPFWLGCVVGIAPWLAIGIYLWSPGSAAEPPAFVYAIFVSLFVFFNIFAINMLLQYRGRPLAQLRLRRNRLHHLESRGEVGPRVAGVRRNAGRLMGPSRSWPDAPVAGAS